MKRAAALGVVLAAAAGCGDNRPPKKCIASASPEVSAQVALEDAFPMQEALRSPIVMTYPPGDDSTFYIVEQDGRILSFPNDPLSGQRTVVLDLADEITSPGDFNYEQAFETGLLGFAFHPNFAQNRTVFLVFTVSTMSTVEPRDTVLARFTMGMDGKIVPGSRTDFLRIPQAAINHQGGTILFGPDGFLYMTVGDDMRAELAQDPGQLYGKLLRLDVDQPDGGAGKEYSIPASNPFAGGGGRGEVYAYGLRNPWKMSFDADDRLWLGDVGQHEWEEVNEIVSGGNYGWPIFEGPGCKRAQAICDALDDVQPVLAYPHQPFGRSQLSGVSVTAGHWYTGTEVPALVGAYVFGDHSNGRLWTMRIGDEVVEQELLVDRITEEKYPGFAQDLDGEIYVMEYLSGRVYKFVQADASTNAGPPMPARLSDTGCFDTQNAAIASEELIPYDVRSELWSDGADKRRWMSIPRGESVFVDKDGQLVFPPGSILAKEFSRNGVRLETRLFVHHTDGVWAGYSYAWDGGDATLVGAEEVKTLSDGSNDWRIPTRSECKTCHTSATLRTLGLELSQLATGDQLERLLDARIFEEPPTVKGTLTAVNGQGSVEARARSYLHSNCSGCHRPGSQLTRTSIDLRFYDGLGDELPLSEMRVCNAVPGTDFQGDMAGDRLLVPGASQRSILVQRMLAEDPGRRMPPLGTVVVHGEATAAVSAWIDSLSSCD